jgi:ubiquinone/menaquinone biosynthesis C-methylase UbiE/uncharacterized protein YbaR (Trm112 family)
MKTIEILACPLCHSKLQYLNNESFKCSKCKKIWPSENGVIILLKNNKIIDKELNGIAELDKINKFDIANEDFRYALLSLPDFPKTREFSKGEDYFYGVAIGKEIFNKAKKIIGKNKIVLEIGADWCWASRQIAKESNYVIALDINKKHLQSTNYLSEKGKNPFFTRIIGDMNNLPLKNNSIDVIIGIACVHHTTNLNNTFKELARVLNPGGKIILLREPVRGRKSSEGKFGENEKQYGINEHIPTLKEWTTALQKAGFDYKYEISKLNFLTGEFRINKLFRLIKRNIISWPFVGNKLIDYTSTDRNIFAIKK